LYVNTVVYVLLAIAFTHTYTHTPFAREERQDV